VFVGDDASGEFGVVMVLLRSTVVTHDTLT